MQEDSILTGTKASSRQEDVDEPNLYFKVSPSSIIYRYLFLVLITIIGLSIIVMLMPATLSGKDFLTSGLLIFWALALGRYWAFMLSMPYQILLTDDDTLKLRSLLHEREIPCEEIVQISVSSIQQTYLKIITSRKKSFLMINHINGLYELIIQLKKINPGLETKGC